MLRPPTSARIVASALVLLLFAGCSTDAVTETAASEAPAPPTTSTTVVPTVEVAGSEVLMVRAGERQRIASVDDGDVVFASLRPGRGPQDTGTVLVLVRTAEHYELRYANVVAGTPSDLYWFPYRLQVDPDSASISDVPPLPVWSPDGSAVAWLEWTADGTRLRTVGWLDHEAGTNPSDDVATYDVAEVPTGSQLDAWRTGPDGSPVLVTRGDEAERWRIRIEEGRPIIALEPSGR